MVNTRILFLVRKAGKSRADLDIYLVSSRVLSLSLSLSLSIKVFYLGFTFTWRRDKGTGFSGKLSVSKHIIGLGTDLLHSEVRVSKEIFHFEESI